MTEKKRITYPKICAVCQVGYDADSPASNTCCEKHAKIRRRQMENLNKNYKVTNQKIKKEIKERHAKYNTIDRTLKYCAKNNVSYAEYQQRRTLELVGKIQLKEDID